MWVRKTEQDFEDELFESKREELLVDTKKKKLKSAIISALVTFVVLTIFLIMKFKFSIGQSQNYNEKPNTWAEIYNLSYYYWFFPLIFALIVFFYKYYSGEKILIDNTGADLYICDKCNSKTFDAHEICPCGGTYVNVVRLKWVETENN